MDCLLFGKRNTVTIYELEIAFEREIYIMEDENIITWIIPVYNGEKYIRQAIESVLNQPCKALEVLIVDDGSVDSTKKIVHELQKYDNRVRYIYKSNEGVSVARNLGIRNINTQYLSFLDADDVLCKNVFDDDIFRILKSGNYDLVSFNYISANQILTRGNPYLNIFVEKDSDGKEIDCFKHIASFLYKTDLFKRGEASFFMEGVRVQEDVTFLFRLLNKSIFVRSVDRFWFAYRNNVSSVLHSFDNYDYIINDAVPAWHLCREACIDKDAINQCDARLVANVSEYILYSCRIGVPVETILSELKKAPIDESLRNQDALWPDSKKIYEKFCMDPERYWKSQYGTGLKNKIKSKIKNNSFARKCYHNIKYKTNIKEYI